MVKKITIFIVAISLAAFIWVIVPSSYYFLNGSPVPQPQLGQTVPIIVNHNKTIYVTPEADKFFNVGNAVVIGILSVSLISLLFWPTKKSLNRKNL